MSQLPKALAELLDTRLHFAGPDGYWLKDGHKENPGLANLEFAEFFEPVWRPDHKKSFLDEEGEFKLSKPGEESLMHGRVDSLLDLYNGLAATPRIIGQAFFMYSAGCVNWHLHALRLSRKYKCEPDLNSILEVAEEKEKNLITKRSQALSVCAFTLYEGAGALGGYNAKQWLFWGRIWGMETPLQMGKDFLSAKEAGECCAKFLNAEMQEKKALFKQWLPLGYPNLPEGVDDMLWTYWSWVELYQSMEGGFLDPEVDNPNHLGALLAGFVRRAAKGYLIAQKYDLHKAFGQDAGPQPLIELILDNEEEIEELLKTNQGSSAFGQWITRIIEAQSDRSELVENIVERGEIALQNSESAKRMSKEGLAYRMSQRGRTRFNRLR